MSELTGRIERRLRDYFKPEEYYGDRQSGRIWFCGYQAALRDVARLLPAHDAEIIAQAKREQMEWVYKAECGFCRGTSYEPQSFEQAVTLGAQDNHDQTLRGAWIHQLRGGKPGREHGAPQTPSAPPTPRITRRRNHERI